MLRNTLVFLLFLVVSARTQQIGQNAPANGNPANFSISSQLVVETVNVKDKNGKPVEGLTAKDFTVTEDGAEQSIRLFEYQKVSEVAEPERPIPAVAQPLKKLPEAQITAEKPGDLRYQDRRLLVLYFDMTAMPPPDQLRAISAAQKFIRTQMTPADRMALMRFEGGAVRVMSDFTQDRERLNSILETMIVGEAQGFDETTSDDSTPDTGAAFGQDDSEFNIFNTNRQLSALQTAAHMLGQLSEKKSMLYFASGLRLNGLDNQAQLHATINAAVRAGSVVLAHRRARLSGPGSPGRRYARIAGRQRHVHRLFRAGHDHQFPAIAGHAVCAGLRYRREGAARQQRPGKGHRTSAE